MFESFSEEESHAFTVAYVRLLEKSTNIDHTFDLLQRLADCISMSNTFDVLMKIDHDIHPCDEHENIYSIFYCNEATGHYFSVCLDCLQALFLPANFLPVLPCVTSDM